MMCFCFFWKVTYKKDVYAFEGLLKGKLYSYNMFHGSYNIFLPLCSTYITEKRRVFFMSFNNAEAIKLNHQLSAHGIKVIFCEHWIDKRTL